MEKILAILLLCVTLFGCTHPVKSLRIDTNYGTIKVHGKLLKASWRF